MLSVGDARSRINEAHLLEGVQEPKNGVMKNEEELVMLTR
jgi:hypothetical protein